MDKILVDEEKLEQLAEEQLAEVVGGSATVYKNNVRNNKSDDLQNKPISVHNDLVVSLGDIPSWKSKGGAL